MKHSLLRQNTRLLLGLAIVGQLLSAAFLLLFAQKPRLEATLDFAFQQVLVVEHSLSLVPAAQRPLLVERLNQHGYLHLQEHPPAFPAAPQTMPRVWRFLLLRALPAPWHDNTNTVRWQALPAPGLWLPLSAAAGQYWIKIDLKRLEWLPSGVWAWAFLSSGLLSLAGALLIQRRINRPLQHLVKAAQCVGQGKAAQLDEADLPPEIATVAHSFNVMQKHLAQAEQTRNVMLAGVSHDLRTPLTKMRLALELLPTPDTDLQQRLIRDLEGINQQLRQFMDFARADVAETPVDADLNELVHYVVSPLREQGGNITLQLTTLPIFAFAPQSLARVLQNLIENALKYADNACSVHTYADATGVFIEVLDRGNGLIPTELERIKQPFVRGEHTQKQAGSGLGLAIVERILQRNGGQLTLQNRADGGLQARITLAL